MELQYLWQSEDKVKVGKAINSSAEMWGICGKCMLKTAQENAQWMKRREKISNAL